MIKLIIPLTIYLLCASASTSEIFRLPTNLRPNNYKINILTHMSEKDGYTFKGQEWISVTCIEDTYSLVIHTKNLTIDEEKVKIYEVSPESNRLHHLSSNFDTDLDFFIYTVNEKMKSGKEYLIYLEFEGDLNEAPTGFYRSSYFDLKEKKDKWVAATQFEPTSARRAFPCFDEPEMKATFEITIGHHKELTALSNMPIKSSEPIKGHPDYVWDHFEKTVRMSTYLVAYIVHDYVYKESVPRPDDTKFKIWTRRDAIDQVDFSKEFGPKCLSFYEEYFNEKFPLPKMDMISIPNFEASAMENWGLITYDETALLFKPNVSTASDQITVASVVAHELAHQLFGNLVTMKWWNDAWLNEGFATYVASLGVSHVHPEWKTMDSESFKNTHLILSMDVGQSNHPVSATIKHPEDIQRNFDPISYQKGSTIIRMMHLFLGEKTFRFGVSKYLKRHKYGNAEQNDLWKSLTEEAHRRGTLSKTISVKQIMDSWTLQTGYPIITVIRNYEKGTAEVTQSRFGDNDWEGCWWIPLSWTDGKELDFNSTKPKVWLKCDSADQPKTVTIKNLPNDTWVLFNVKLSGLYRVRYDDKNLDLLIDALNGPNYKQIHEMNRAQIINDVLDLTWIGNEVLRLASYLKQEEDYLPWSAAIGQIHKINSSVKGTGMYKYFKEYVQKLLTPIYEKVNGLNDDCDLDVNAIKLKSMIVGNACEFDVGDCIEKSIELFEDWMDSENPDEDNPIPLNLRYVVYCTAIKHGDKSESDFLHRRFKNSNVEVERKFIKYALIGCKREVDSDEVFE